MSIPSHGPTCQSLSFKTRRNICGDPIVFLKCDCGSRVSFDKGAPHWHKHICLDMNRFLYSVQTQDELRKLGFEALERNNFRRARLMFGKDVYLNSTSSAAWGRLYNVLEEDTERKFCLEQIVTLSPHDIHFGKLLVKMANVESRSPGVLRMFPPISQMRPLESPKIVQQPIPNRMASATDMVKCSFCNSLVRPKNMQKHLKKVHSDIVN